MRKVLPHTQSRIWGSFLVSLVVFCVFSSLLLHRAYAFTEPIGFVDPLMCGNAVVTGWTCDADDFSIPPTVQLYIDGYPSNLIAQTQATLARDASVALSCGGYANRGFSFALPSQYSDVTNHTFLVYARNVDPTGGSVGSSLTMTSISCPAIPSPTPVSPGSGTQKCGDTCNSTSDCYATGANGAPVACVGGICQNTLCIGKTVPGRNCDCSILNACGQPCGSSVGLCQADSFCGFITASSQCVAAEGNTSLQYCLPNVAQQGYSTGQCVGIATGYLINPQGQSGSPPLTQQDVIRACTSLTPTPTPVVTPTPVATPLPGGTFVDVKVNGSNGPVTISPNDTITISWTSNNAVNCNSGTSLSPWGQYKPLATQGSTQLGPNLSNITIGIQCAAVGNPNQVVQDSVGVFVVTPPSPSPVAPANADGKCVIGWATTYKNALPPDSGYLPLSAIKSQKPGATYKTFNVGLPVSSTNYELNDANLADLDVLFAVNSQSNYDSSVLASLTEGQVISVEERVKRGMMLLMVGDNGSGCGDDAANFTYQLNKGPWLRTLFGFSNQCMDATPFVGGTYNYTGNPAYNWLNGLPIDTVNGGGLQNPGWVVANSFIGESNAGFTSTGRLYATQNGWEAGFGQTDMFSFYPPYSNSYGKNGWMFIDANAGIPSRALVTRQAFWDQIPDCKSIVVPSPTPVPTPTPTPSPSSMIRARAVVVNTLQNTCSYITDPSVSPLPGTNVGFSAPGGLPRQTQTGGTYMNWNSLLAGSYTVDPSPPSANYVLQRMCYAQVPGSSGEGATTNLGYGVAETYTIGYSPLKPWVQIVGGNVTSNGSVNISVPASNQLIAQETNQNSPSIAFSGSLNTGTGSVSNQGYQVNQSQMGPPAGFTYYTYYYNRFSAPKTAISNILNTMPAPGTMNSPGLYEAGGAGNLTIGTNNWNVGVNQSLVVFVPGNLTINSQIQVADGGFIAFIVAGNITVGNTVGFATPQPAQNRNKYTQANISGLFITNGEFITEPTPNAPDRQLVVAGSVVARSLRLQRDLDPQNMYPGEVFFYRPDLTINAPKGMSEIQITWTEVAP